jgi:integrase
MTQQARAYLKYRRSLGFGLESSGRQLLHFARFLDQSGHRGPLTTELILRWVHLPKGAARSHKANRLSAARGFAQYLLARDGCTEVPDRKLLPKVYRHRPHLYSQQDLEQLLAAAGRMKSTYPLRPLTYQTLLGLLAATGVRISEALNLTRGHVDLERSILIVEQTKFKKSRLVPLHPTATRALRHYARARDGQWGQERNKPFFVGPCGTALRHSTIRPAFRKLCNGLGWHRGTGEWPRPRIHDLRHSFACRRLLLWYREGEDVHHRLAALSTYLGHGKVTSTYWYLSGTPELLAIAGNRFERFAIPAVRRHS